MSACKRFFRMHVWQGSGLCGCIVEHSGLGFMESCFNLADAGFSLEVRLSGFRFGV